MGRIATGVPPFHLALLICSALLKLSITISLVGKPNASAKLALELV